MAHAPPLPSASRQENADYIKGVFGRRFAAAGGMVPSVERVEALSGLRKHIDEIRSLPDFDPGWIASLDAQLAGMVEECRVSGHQQEYAEMSRPRRRALKRLVGGAW